MLPNRCSVVEAGSQCPSPPSHVVSIVSEDGEYMVGVSCAAHAESVAARVRRLQEGGGLRAGEVRLEELSAVGTDCVKGDPDDLITPDRAPS